MRISLLDHLACPICHGELVLMGEGAISVAQVEEGELWCRECPARYPIWRGIPRFPIADGHGVRNAILRTRRTYDFTWRRFGKREIEERWEKDSYRFAELIPGSLTHGGAKVGLDAGCGGGADLLRLAAGGAELIGFDISEGVETTSRMSKHLHNVHVVQGDIHLLPFRAKSFDFIYSFGVLHHLPDPQIGFVGLANLLKPGAPLITYLYEDFSDRSIPERLLLGLIRGLRRITSRLPPRLLYALCWLIVPSVWLFCAVPAQLLRRRLPRLAERIPFRHTLRWPVLASDLFDRFAPPLEWRFSQKGVRRLYEQAGLERVEVRRHRGWVSWGFAPDSGSGSPESISGRNEEAPRISH